ncbi:hypothetical protein H2201_008877, partial [Coniosporium apollinis]
GMGVSSRSGNGGVLSVRDPFSVYRSGFEVRCYRICRRILMFHHFPEEEGVGANCLVASTDFTYRAAERGTEEDDRRIGEPRGSFIISSTQKSYKRRSNGEGYDQRAFPSIDFAYSQPTISDEVLNIDPESLQDLPAGLADTNIRWVDLYGEGISGMLMRNADSGWQYKANFGRGKFAPAQTVKDTPSISIKTQLIDLSGDGNIDWVNFSAGVSGYFKGSRQGWQSHRPFDTLPNIDWEDPNLVFVDLTGDGLPDICISEGDVLTWYPSLGEQGFGNENKQPTSWDDKFGTPQVLFSDPTQEILLSDMSGDGLVDIARIRNGEVCYWPNLGYGRFGDRVTMRRSPRFDTCDLFDSSRIRLVDIDGSGTTDLVYLAESGPQIFFNECGNAWSTANILPPLPPYSRLADIQSVDLLGTGTSCLVWSSPLPSDYMGRQMRYINLMADGKPHLLTSIINNLGAETRFHYASSTEFYLRDRAADYPWITPVPFPVHLVESVETIDRISRNVFTSRYEFHHGFFDGREREFCGFGRVDEYSVKDFGAVRPGVTNQETPTQVLPPLLTKTWFHTGQHVDNHSDLSERYRTEYYREPGLDSQQKLAMCLPPSSLPTVALLPDGTDTPHTLFTVEEAEARRALKGALLRREIFSLDASFNQTSSREYDVSEHPYAVLENCYAVNLSQPRSSHHSCVVFSNVRESVTWHYERALFKIGDKLLADPRVVHEFNLAINPLGMVRQSAMIAYKRRHKPASNAFATELEEQYEVTALSAEHSFTKSVETQDAYRAPQLAESRTLQLFNVLDESSDPLVTNLVSVAHIKDRISQASDGRHDLPIDGGDIPSDDEAYRRLLSHSCTYFRSDDFETVLPLGEAEAQAHLYETLTLTATNSSYRSHFVNTGRLTDIELDDVLTNEAHYVRRDGNWWVSSGKSFYSPKPTDLPATELIFAREHFFTPRRYIAPNGAENQVDYDKYCIGVVQTRDTAGNLVTVGERKEDGSLGKSGMDYRVLKPKLIMDSNRNRVETSFDILGLVVGAALRGKPEEDVGDNLDDFEPEMTEDGLTDYLINPVAFSVDLLGSATSRAVYDLFAYQRTKNSPDPLPASSSTIGRETHLSELEAGEETRVNIVFAYSDGFGRQIQSKLRVAAGIVPLRDDSGKILLDEINQPVMGNDPVDPRWICSGWTIFDNQGNPVRKYETFFTDLHRFEFDVRAGVSPIMFYDALGRPIAVLSPNHVWSKVAFDPWTQTAWTPGDTVKIDDPREDTDVGAYFAHLEQKEILPTWYQQRVGGALGQREQKAAEQSATYADAPSTRHYNTLGREIFVVGQIKAHFSNGITTNEKQTVKLKLDSQGRQLEIRDALHRQCAANVYDVAGNLIYQKSMDNGERWTIASFARNPLRVWNSRGIRGRSVYDSMQRILEEYVKEGQSAEVLASRYIYGESLPNPEARNCRTKLVTVFDQAGKVLTDMFDFKGLSLHTSRQLAKDHKATLDWSREPVQLEDGVFASSSTHDALGRSNETLLWDGTKVRMRYDIGGSLVGLEANLQGESESKSFIRDIKYDARGQRTRIEYGNEVIKTYEYDRLTAQVRHVMATRPDGKVLQSLHYVFDVLGNIVYIEDRAQQTLFFRNQPVTPDCEYVYDSSSRLIEGTGREHIGQASDPRKVLGAFNDFQSRVILANDSGAMVRYLERYQYNKVGNITSLQHDAGSSSGWTRNYEYADTATNRLTSTIVGTTTESYLHDENGNMISMPHLSRIAYDFKDRLRATAKTTVNNGGTPTTTWYTYENTGSRVRKVTERQASPGQTPTKAYERIYLGALEILRRYESNGTTIRLERATVNLTDDQDPLCRIDMRSKGRDEQGIPDRIARYQLTNHLRSTSMELDDSAKVASYEEYTPFGSTTYSAVDSELEVPKQRRWCNKERDEENGFYYFGARYYAPWLARWTSADPLGLKDGLNVFVYSSNNPIMRTDPNGMESKEVEVLLEQTLIYLYKIKNRTGVGQNVQRDHALAQKAIKDWLGPVMQQLYDKTADATVAVETGKGKWHTIKSTLEKRVFKAIERGDIKTLEDFVEATVKVLVEANAKVGGKPILKPGQLHALLQQTGAMFDSLTLEQAAQLEELWEKGDKAGVDKLMQQIKETRIQKHAVDQKIMQESNKQVAQEAEKRAAAEAEKKAVQAVEKKAAQEAEKQAAKKMVQAAKKAPKGGPGLMARGGGLAFGAFMYYMAETDEERIDAGVSMVFGELSTIPQPHIAAFSRGVVIGQMTEATFNTSDYSSRAGEWGRQGLISLGVPETPALWGGGIITVATTPAAIPVSIVHTLYKWTFE